MKRTGLLLVSAALALAGCQRDDTATKGELADIKSELAEIKKMIEEGGGAARPTAARPKRPRRPRPKPNEVYSVPVEGAPYRGARDAKITVVKGFEFACPFCKRVAPTLDQLLSDYEGDIKIAYKHFVVHPQHATLPALAACAAGKQGKWSKMYDLLWEKAFAKRDFGKENMDKLAKEAGLDMNKFKADMEGDCKKTIRTDQQQLAAVGTSGTPAFYINGRFLSGARPIDQFKAIIDEELKKANERISSGEATVASYYDEFVVKEGKKKLDK